jgi:predicted small lipoprotein YifL
LTAALAGCGVKGELEAPPRADIGAQPKPSAETGAKTQSQVFREGSAVRNVSRPDIAPRMPPKEWGSEEREYQSAPKPRAPKGKGSDDEPFFLDRIL